MTYMPFGKYRGCLLCEIPTDYLKWLLSIDLSNWLYDEVELELIERGEHSYEQNANRGAESATAALAIPAEHKPMVREIVERGYRASAQVHHPDHGGSNDIMRALNAAAEWLRRLLQ